MLQRDSKGSFSLRHCSRNLHRPEDTKASDLDLRNQQDPTLRAHGMPRTQPCVPTACPALCHPRLFQALKILLNSNAGSSCSNKRSFHLPVKKTETPRSGVTCQMWIRRQVAKSNSGRGLPAPTWGSPDASLPSEKGPRFIHFSLAYCLMFI